MESGLHEIVLRVLFSLRYLHVKESQWDFYINYVPEIGSNNLNKVFGGGNDAPIMVAQNDFLRRNTRPLVNEIRSLIPPDPKIAVGGIPVKLVGGFWALAHYVTGWPQAGAEVVEWTKNLWLVNGQPIREGTTGHVAIASLSDASRACLARLDGFAVITARERFADKVSKAALFEPGAQVLPKRTRVFIAYRSTEIEFARAFHRLLTDYGQRAIFEPYLDLHDLELGSLRSQLRKRVTEWADLFLPLVSDTYAAPGSISADELAWARERASALAAFPSFIAPVYVGSPHSAVAKELFDLVHGNVAAIPDVTPHEGLSDFLVYCARA